MPDPEFYKTIEQSSQAEFKDRGSRFLAYAFPIESAEKFKSQLQHLKKEHPKAVHHCFAYRLGLDANNFRQSDDGEPAGTAGKPILGQIDSKQLTNTLVVVVRYFGGTLLGVPGLINAYKTAASLTLQLIPIIQKPITTQVSISFDYTQMNEVMRWLKAFNCEIVSQELQLFCLVVARVPRNKLQDLQLLMADLQGVEMNLALERLLK